MRPEPGFIDGPRGRLFAIRRRPAAGDRVLDIVVVPPFAEEMNRSRRMVALLGARLAARGVGSLAVDPFGTGDSAGDFAEARWATWIDDILAAVASLEPGRRVALLGIRLGAVLAAEAARRTGAVDRLVLWQPVTSGEAFMTQVLRLRLAGDMAQADAARVTTKDLRARLASGEALEVAGYVLAPALVAAIDGLRLAALPPLAGTPVEWLEVAADPSQGIAPAARPVIDAWTKAGAVVNAAVVAGEPFWSLQETTLAPALLDATIARLAGDQP